MINATPFGLFFGENDTTCPRWAADDVKETMGDMMQAFKVYEGLDHTTVIMFNTEAFVQDMKDFFAPSEQGDSDLTIS